MSLKQRVQLELEDGREIQVTYDGRDLRAWEAKHRKSALVEPMSLSMLSWLGHHAGVRTGAINSELTTYDAFDKVLISVGGLPDEDDDEETDEEPDPPETESEDSPSSPGDDSSAHSP